MAFKPKPDQRDTSKGITPNKSIKRPTNPPVKKIMRPQGK